MAVDTHALNFLLLASRDGPFGRTATIGRQNLSVSAEAIKRLFDLSEIPDFGPFCETLLKRHLGATLVDSYDYSDFEGATHVVDLNKPLIDPTQYDTVIDCGSLEHIYNAPQALRNVSLLCARGGRILHILPANNYCGHGFWQFSPELFFSLYSRTNGYGETRIFLAGIATDRWYEVKPPQNGQRVDVTSCTKLLILVITRRMSCFHHDNVQQSDYVHAWTGALAPARSGLGGLLLGPPESSRRAYAINRTQQNVHSAVSKGTVRSAPGKDDSFGQEQALDQALRALAAEQTK